jgi:MFS family permease
MDDRTGHTARPRVLAALPPSVWALGFVSLCMDLSSEMIHSLLPLFLIGALGASPALLGLIEGIAEAASQITKLFSGALSDWIGQRKPLVLLGYGLAALTKPAFPLAPSALWILFARLTDRIGKGLRGAPRDALIADVTPPAMRGAAFGLRQALDTAGAVGGPLAAIALMMWLGDIRAVFWWAAIPALCAVLVLIFAVKEPAHPAQSLARPRLALRDLSRLSAGFWAVTGIGVLFTLARFSEAFLVLKGAAAGFVPALAPLVMVAMNLVYALVAAPAGVLSDRTGRLRILAAGLGVLVMADLALAFAQDTGLVLLGAGLWGLHLGLTQGIFSALVTDRAPPDLRATAFGVFNFSSGMAMLGANAVGGLLWQAQGPAATFLAGGLFALLALLAMAALRFGVSRP